MKSSENWVFRLIAACLVVLLTAPAGQSGLAWSQQAGSEPRPAAVPLQSQSGSPGADPVIAENALPDNPEPASPQPGPRPQATDQSAQGGNNPQPAATQQQNGAQQPVGTAAAPYERTMGVAASRPAGAAIAPGKQRRVRTILISVGVIVAAGVAIGTVAGLSRASASRPQ